MHLSQVSLYSPILWKRTSELHAFVSHHLTGENRAWIAGVVVAAFITIAIPVGILFCYWRRHKRRPKRNSCDAAPDKTQLQSDCLLKTMPEADTNGIYELYVRPTPLGAEMPANEVATREVSVRDETTAVELDMTRELGEMMASSDVSGGSRRPN